LRSLAASSGDENRRVEKIRRKWIPSGNLLHSYGKSPFLMGKLTINGHNEHPEHPETCFCSKGFHTMGAMIHIYPLVNIQKAIENGHRNSGFTH